MAMTDPRQEQALMEEAYYRAKKRGTDAREEYERLRYELFYGNPYGGNLYMQSFQPPPNQQMLGNQMQQISRAFGGLGAGSVVEKKSPVDKALLDKLMAATPRQVLRATPDYTQAVVGWRAWRSAEVNGEWRLKALGKETIWEPKAKIEAKCEGYSKGHPAPHKSCECGVWSFSSMEKLITALDGYGDQKIIGECHIWGRVIECENGYRSQFAYPKELWLLDESMEQLGYIYGVPIRTAK